MPRAEFFETFKAFLVELDPGLDLSELAPDTHLWEKGYLDSFAMLSVVAFIEDETGREVALNPDTLPDFFTVDRIYAAYVEPNEVAR